MSLYDCSDIVSLLQKNVFISQSIIFINVYKLFLLSVTICFTFISIFHYSMQL